MKKSRLLLAWNSPAFGRQQFLGSWFVSGCVFRLLHILEIWSSSGGSGGGSHVQVCGEQISSGAQSSFPPRVEPKGRLKWSETINLKPVIGGELCWYRFPMTSSLQKGLECCPARPSTPNGGDDGQADALFFTSDGRTGGLKGSTG